MELKTVMMDLTTTLDVQLAVRVAQQLATAAQEETPLLPLLVSTQSVATLLSRELKLVTMEMQWLETDVTQTASLRLDMNAQLLAQLAILIVEMDCSMEVRPAMMETTTTLRAVKLTAQDL